MPVRQKEGSALHGVARKGGKSLASKSGKGVKGGKNIQATKHLAAHKNIFSGLGKAAKKAAPPLAGVRKKPRKRPGTLALMEIRRYQKSTDPLIPYAPVVRLVRQIIQDVSSSQSQGGLRLQEKGAHALREGAESYMVGLFEDANLCAIHGKRITVMPKDVHLSRRIRGETA